MNIKRFSAVAAAGVLSLGLALGAPTTAQAAVAKKDVPTKATIVKIYPGLKGGEFSVDRSKKVSVPAKKCGTSRVVKVRSTRTVAGANSSGLVVVTGVIEFKSKSAAKGAMSKQKRFVRKCDSFKVNGIRTNVSRDKAPKLGQDRVAMTAVTRFSGYRGYASSVIIRHGKRIATITVADDRKVSKKKLHRLARITAKKMR